MEATTTKFQIELVKISSEIFEDEDRENCSEIFLSYNNEVVGFISINDYTCKIEYSEIFPQYRTLGFYKHLIKSVFDYYEIEYILSCDRNKKSNPFYEKRIGHKLHLNEEVRLFKDMSVSF
jgi:hypothetical protein